MERIDEIKADFRIAADYFTETRRKDDRDSGMNAKFRAQRAEAATYVNQILDEYLDLKAMEQQVTPLEPAETA